MKHIKGTNYLHLAAIAYILLSVVWAECGFPIVTYSKGYIMLCAYNAPMHEKVFNLVTEVIKEN